MLGAIGRFFGFGKQPSRRTVAVKAGYDSAQSTNNNTNHWANADSLSARSANSLAVRKKLRERARYEVANNCYARGMINTLANDVIGRGPRLSVSHPDRKVAGEIEKAFAKWAKQVDLAGKLRTLRASQCQDGEVFGTFITNRRLPGVKLDIRPIEADQVTEPATSFASDDADGIRFDADGNPVSYSILRKHPGDLVADLTAENIDAGQVFHLFKCERPGQVRGIPEITAALPLYAYMRRYELAVIAAMEAVASMGAIIIQTNAPPDGEADEIAPLDTLDIERGMMTTMPAGWAATQMKPEQPGSSFSEVIEHIIREIARVLNMPFNVAAGDSSKYNYASGRLDHQVYFKQIEIDRERIERVILDRLAVLWMLEAREGVLDGMPFDEIEWSWYWDGHEHVDPQKEAQGQAIRLANGTTHRRREYARLGLDMDAEDEAAAEGFGMSVEDYRKAVASKLLGAAPAAPADSKEDAGDSDAEDESETEEEAADAA